MDGDFDSYLLFASDPDEVHMDKPAAKVIPLDLARHRKEVLAVDAQVDEHVHPRLSVENMEELLRIDGHLHGVDSVAVHDSGHPALRTNLSRHALPGRVAPLDLQLLFHRIAPRS